MKANSHLSIILLSFAAAGWVSNAFAAGETRGLVSSDGAALFGSRCAHCHGSGVIQPDVRGLSRLRAEEIYHTLWSGIMREAANGLDDAQRRSIAEYVASLNPDKASEKISGYCGRDAVATGSPITGTWSGWAPSPDNSRYLEHISISKSQAQKARLKWAFVFPDTGATTNAGNQPTVVDGRLYIGHRNKYVYSLDAGSGCVHWSFKARAGVRSAIVIVGKLALFGDYENNVYAVEAMSGRLVWIDRADEQPSARINGNLVVHDGIVYVPISSNQEFVNALDPALPCCSFRGNIVAYEIRTGRRIWKTNTIDQPLLHLGQNPAGVKRYGPSGGAVWSISTVDAKRGLLYVGTSNQYTGPVVKESDAVVAFDLKTGEKKWVRNFAPERTGGVDVWNGGCVGVLGDPAEECPEDNVSGVGDWDLGSPVVVQTREDGSEILLVGSKEGMLFALDPDQDGKTLWARRVGKIMSVQGPSFGGIEHGISADRKRAYVPIADIDVIEGHSDGSLVAVDLMSGEILWRTRIPDDVCKGKPVQCSKALTAPSTVVNGVVFAPANDGVLRIYDTETGEVLWSYDTVATISGVNGLKGFGGSITRSGTTIVDGMFFQTSGYGQGLGMPGHVLYAFEIPEQD